MTKLHILLIEDDEDDYILLQSVLRKISHLHAQITWVQRAADAEAYLNEDSGDIVLVDYRLGEVNGIDVIKSAQKSGLKKPMILLTGLGTEELGIKALRAGADDYLIKSDITPVTLERAIRYAIERKEMYHRQQELFAAEKAREEGEKERKHLYTMFMEAPALVCILKGEKGIVELCNNEMYNLLGKKNAVGRQIREVWPNVFTDDFFEIIKNVYTSGKTVYKNEYLLTLDKNHEGHEEEIYLNIVCQVVRDVEGKKDGVMIHGINVTDEVIAKKKLVESESRLRRIVDSNMVGILFYDITGKVYDANDAFLEITGYTRKDLHNSSLNIMKMTPVEFEVNDKKAIHELEHFGVCTPYEKELIKKDGSRVPIYVGAAQFEADHSTGVAFILDITERKRLERQKDEFIGVATHELKTPVTSIKAYTQLLHNRFTKAGDTSSSSMLLKMDVQLNKLISLISDLLDVTKIEGGKLSFSKEKFNMTELATEIVEELQRTTDRHTIRIEGTIRSFITADRDRTGQVLTNLITNAIKYSPHADEITVHLSEEEDSVTVCVQDYGVGIPQDKQEKVFERFFRVSGPKEDTFPGLGLGLYISSEIIKRQHGKIWVESIEKKGSTFCFSLPCNAFPEKA